MLDAADVHVAQRLCALAAEEDELVALAVAFVVRAVRGGSVCVDLATVADEPTPSTCPWPDPDAWHAAIAASPLVTCRAAGAAAARARRGAAALPRPLLARGGAGARRPRRPPGRRRPTPDEAWLAAALDRVFPRRGVRRAAGRCPGRPHPRHDGAHRRARHRQDHHGRRAARALCRAGRAGRRPARPHRPGRADRQGRGPAPAGRRGGGREAAGRRPRAAGRRPRRSPCTGCSAPGPTRRHGSGTTATTGCPTTSSSSTRPRWSR